MKTQTRIAAGLGALALGLALATASTSSASAQAWAAGGYGTGNPLPLSFGSNGAPVITPWNNPDNIGAKMNGLYSSSIVPLTQQAQPLYAYVPPKAVKHHKRKVAR